MTEKQLINKIRKCKSVKPDSDWFFSARQDLIDQLVEEAELKPSNSFFDWIWFHRLQPAVLTACLMLIVVGGPLLTVKAAQSSLPGEWLYNVKKITEKIQVQIASQDSKAQIQVRFASRRLVELNKITNDSFSEEEKIVKTKEVIVGFSENMAKASLAVQKMPKEKVAVIAEKTKRLEEDLDDAKDDLSVEAEDEMAVAKEAVEEVNAQIMAVLIEDEETTEETATSTDDIIEINEEDIIEDIIEVIEERIEDNQIIDEPDTQNETSTQELIVEEEL